MPNNASNLDQAFEQWVRTHCRPKSLPSRGGSLWDPGGSPGDGFGSSQESWTPAASYGAAGRSGSGADLPDALQGGLHLSADVLSCPMLLLLLLLLMMVMVMVVAVVTMMMMMMMMVMMLSLIHI